MNSRFCAALAKATLLLHATNVTGTGTFLVAPACTAWTESSLNYINRPYGCYTAGGSGAFAAADETIAVDVTQFVQMWLNGQANNGMVLTIVNGKTAVTFDSKENTKTSQPPRLDIILAGPQGATGPQGQQARSFRTAGGMCMPGRTWIPIGICLPDREAAYISHSEVFRRTLR